jgi:lysophospholipase L1-like esterase
MTTKEEQTLTRLEQLITLSYKENQEFKVAVSKQVNNLQEIVTQKQLPITLEQDIVQKAQQAVGESIKSIFTSHNNPLYKLIVEIVNNHTNELKTLINDSFETVIRTEDFKKSILNAFSHKVAKTIISNNDGLFDKVANELKQDSIFKAKMQLAVSNVVNECLKEKNEG